MPYSLSTRRSTGLSEILCARLARRQLGIEMIAAYLPEARGRSERAFVPRIGGCLDDVLCEQFERTVGAENYVHFEGLMLQIPADRHRCHYVTPSAEKAGNSSVTEPDKSKNPQHALLDFEAMLARLGFGGPTAIFDHGHTVFGAFSRKPEPDFLIDELGARFDGIMKLAIKPYTCVSFLHPGLDALMEIAREHKFKTVAGTVASADRLTQLREEIEGLWNAAKIDTCARLMGAVHQVEADAEEAQFTLTSRNRPSIENPKTRRIIALSVLAALRSLVAPIQVGS